MALQDTDNLIVQRGSTLNKVQIQNMSTIQDTDLLVVGRGSESYKITGQDFKDSIGPSGTVDKPSIIAPADNAGEMVSAESDEITGFSFTSYSSLPTTGSSYGDAYPWSLAFRSIVDQDGAVGSTDATHYIQSFANIPATTVGLIVDNNLQWVGVAVNGVDLDISNAPISGSYAGNDLDAGFTTAVVREYTLPAGNTLDSIGVKTNGPRICGVIVDGTRLTDGQPALTLAGDKDLTVFQPLDDVQQDSGYTPQTSAITGVSGGGSYASTWFTDGTAVNDPNDANNTWDKAFNGTQTAPSDGTYGTGLPLTFTFAQSMVGEWVFDVYLGTGINTGSKDIFQLDDYVIDGDDPNWITFGESQYGRWSWTGTVNKITLPNGAMYLNKVTFNQAFLIVGNPPAGTASTVLTLTDDTDLANFRAGDQVLQDNATAASEAQLFHSATNGDYRSYAELNTNATRVDTWDNIPDGGYFYWYKGGSEVRNIGESLWGEDTTDNSIGTGWQLQWVFNDGDAWDGNTFAYAQNETNLVQWTDGSAAAYRVPVTALIIRFGRSSNRALPAGNFPPDPEANKPEPRGIVGSILGNTLTLSESFGNWSANTGNYAIGPNCTPATGTVASTDPAAGTMTLSVSDETFPKRWIVNAGKFVKGEETPSQDAAPDVSGDVEVTPKTDQILSVVDTSTPDYTADLTVTGTTWDSGRPLMNAFNGDDSDFAYGLPNGGSEAIEFDPLGGGHPITINNGTFEFKGGNGGASALFDVYVNGTNVTDQLEPQPDGSSWDWHRVPVAGGVLNTFVIQSRPGSGVSHYGVVLHGMKINGEYILAASSVKVLTLEGPKDLDLIEVGDAVKQDNDAATGTVTAIGPGNTISLVNSTGTWSPNTNNYVVGPTTTIPGFLTIYSSDFASTPPGSLGHTSSDWQITLKTDTAYANPVDQAIGDAANLTSWSPAGLEGDTAYRCRVRHRSNDILSEWSEDSTFKTAEEDDDNSLVVKPGDLWVDGANAGLGAFRTTPVKMVSAAWGDRALALGVDGKIYKAPSLSYENMAEILSPPAGVTWTAIAQPYGSNCVAVRDDGLLDMFDSVSETITAQAVTFAGTGARFKAFSAVKNSSQMYFLGDDGRIYVANHLTTPTALTLLYQGHDVRNLAIGISDTDPDKSFFIDTNDDLYILRISGVGGPSASVNSVTQLNAGTKYKSVRIGYEGTAAAITKDGDLQIFLSNAVPTFDTALAANLPADFEIAEVGFGYLNIFARSKDGRVLVAGAAYGPNGPFKPGQETWSADTWAEYDLPRPCPGFGIIKECGVGYDFAFILP